MALGGDAHSQSSMDSLRNLQQLAVISASFNTMEENTSPAIQKLIQLSL